MSDAFDPYYLWLGIPPGEQPPDHYRLLGIAQFEADADVIRNAAEQRMRYLRTVTGPRAKRAQQLINEIVTAQRVLSEEEAREKYNTLITESPLSRRRGVAPPAVSTPAFEPPSIDTLDTRSHRRRGGRGGGRKKDHTAEDAKFSNWLWWAIIGLSLGVLILTLMMFSRGNHAKITKKEKAREAQNAKKEAERKAQKEPDRKAEIERKERARAEEERKEAESIAKEKAEAESIAKEKAEAELKAKEKAETELMALIAKEAAERKAQELRDNPDKLLKSKGFKKQGGEWVFAKQKTLQKYRGEISVKWKNWKKLPQGNEAAARAKLEKYNELLLATLQIGAMRLAVSEDLTEALNDNAVAEALVKENAKSTELYSTAKALKRSDRKLTKLIPKKPPMIGPFAALIINEKVGVVVHIDEKLLGQKDAPRLFFLPRHVQSKANLHITGHSQKWMNNYYNAAMLDSQVPKLRWGLQAAENFPVNFHPTPSEGGAGNMEEIYRGKVGVGAWNRFVLQLKKVEVDHTPAAIEEARKKLEAKADKLQEETEIARAPHPASLIEDGVAGSDPADDAKDENDADGKPEESSVSFDELKEQLTALEKETKKTLGAFNKEAKAYISNKKSLVKRIKAGEAVYAKRGRQQEAIENPEEKTKFGEETEAKVVKPLNALKAQLKNLAKPDMAPLEEKLKQGEKMVEQLKATSEYAQNSKSVYNLAAAIAKYRKGFEVQQTKMAR